MNRYMSFLLLAALMLSGCAATQDDPFRVDTVVQIPVDPTDAPTEAPTEEPAKAPTETVTEVLMTEPQETAAAKPTSSTGSSGSKGSSSGQVKAKETEPPVVETVPPTQAPTEPPYDPASYSLGSLEYAVLDQFNGFRAENEEDALSISSTLSGIAYLRAKEASSCWSHTRPDGRSFTSALSDYGYGYAAVEELMVSSGSSSAEALVAKWMNSDAHSQKILSSSFSKVGIGVYSAGGTTYVVCLLVG